MKAKTHYSYLMLVSIFFLTFCNAEKNGSSYTKLMGTIINNATNEIRLENPDTIMIASVNDKGEFELGFYMEKESVFDYTGNEPTIIRYCIINNIKDNDQNELSGILSRTIKRINVNEKGLIHLGSYTQLITDYFIYLSYSDGIEDEGDALVHTLIYIDSFINDSFLKKPVATNIIENKDKNIIFISVSLDRKESDWLSTIKKYGMTEFQLRPQNDWSSDFVQDYSLNHYGIPYYMIIDSNGTIKNLTDPKPSEAKKVFTELFA